MLNDNVEEIAIKLQTKEIRESDIDLETTPSSIVSEDPSFSDFVKSPIKTKAAKFEYLDGEGKPFMLALAWDCRPNVRNQLYVGETPFKARFLQWECRPISWQAGDGWPVYSTYCPVNRYSGSMFYRHAKVHQIVPEFGNFYWIGCSNPASGLGSRSTPVYFSVNDDKYSDNRGYFVVIVTSWS